MLDKLIELLDAADDMKDVRNGYMTLSSLDISELPSASVDESNLILTHIKCIAENTTYNEEGYLCYTFKVSNLLSLCNLK